MTYCDAPVLKKDGIKYIAEAVKKFPNRLIGYARLHAQLKGRAISLLEESVLDLKFKGLSFISSQPYRKGWYLQVMVHRVLFGSNSPNMHQGFELDHAKNYLNINNRS